MQRLEFLSHSVLLCLFWKKKISFFFFFHLIILCLESFRPYGLSLMFARRNVFNGVAGVFMKILNYFLITDGDSRAK